jgi:hypothetical protein
MTAEVTKVSVNRIQEKLYSITLNLKLMEGITVLLDENFNQKYRTGQSIPEVMNFFQVEMQASIDKYNEETAIFNHTQLDTVVTTLQNNLTV